MKKIASLILAGAMLLSGFLMPMQVKAESIVVNANNWYEMALPGGTSQEYVYEMPASGYVTVEVVDQYYTYGGKVSDSTSWYMPVKVVVNDVVDGKQRLETIFQFFDSAVSSSKCNTQSLGIGVF